MAGFNHLTRAHKIIEYDSEQQKDYRNLEKVSDYGIDTIFISDDSEWEEDDVSQSNRIRKQQHIISHQYVVKYKYFPAIGFILYRQIEDPPFSFWDLVSVIRYYLYRVGYRGKYDKAELKKIGHQMNLKYSEAKAKFRKSTRIPKITWVGYFSGVDLSAYKDWKNYLRRPGKSRVQFIDLQKHEFFTNNYYPVTITNPKSRRIKCPISIRFVDTMPLGPAGGLAALGEMVNQSKIDTKKFDLQAKLISKKQYEDTNYAGYYKTHMRYFYEHDTDNYDRYALNDSEIVLKYLDFIMKNVMEIVNKYHLLKRVHIPTTLTGLSDEISAHYSHLCYDQSIVEKVYGDIFAGTKIADYLRPQYYNQQPNRDINKWKLVLQSLVKGDAPGEKNFSFQKKFIDKLEPYLASATINYCGTYDTDLLVGTASSPGDNDWSTDELWKKIDYQELYSNNPNFKIEDFTNQKLTRPVKIFPINKNMSTKYGQYLNKFRNSSMLIEIFLQKLYKASIHGKVKDSATNRLVDWSPMIFLEDQLDFDRIRKGYTFNTKNNTPHNINNIQIDSVNNSNFDMARHAYVGGMNVSFNPGVINSTFKIKYNLDLKSSYVNAGHLIPDFILSEPPQVINNISGIQLLQMLDQDSPYLVNGCFTVGIANVSYSFPKSIKRIPVGCKLPNNIGNGPRYVRKANDIDITLTDIFNILKHDGEVQINKLVIPQQKVLNGTVDTLAPIGKMQDWSLNKRRKIDEQLKQVVDQNNDQYWKYSSLALFYKLLGNGGYGKAAQGLNRVKTRDFLTNELKLPPFSRNTNPYTAAQYTAIARYQINYLMDLVEEIYPDSLIPSVTTDGFILCTNSEIDVDKIQDRCRKEFNKQWVLVNEKFFDGQFFELKSKQPIEKPKYKTKSTLYNIRTRFNFTNDSVIKALVGIQRHYWSVDDIIDKFKNDIVSFKTIRHRMQSLVVMKHSIDHKYYNSLKTWKQPEWITLSYDDSYKPIKFIPQVEDDYGYYITEPFDTVNEMETYKAELKPYHYLFPLYRKEYAEAFLKLDNTIGYYGNRMHVAWVHNDVKLKGSNYDEVIKDYEESYSKKVLLRYIAKNQDNLNLRKLYDEKYYKKYGQFGSFKQQLKRNEGTFVNPLCVIKENFEQKLNRYKNS